MMALKKLKTYLAVSLSYQAINQRSQLILDFLVVSSFAFFSIFIYSLEGYLCFLSHPYLLSF